MILRREQRKINLCQTDLFHKCQTDLFISHEIPSKFGKSQVKSKLMT